MQAKRKYEVTVQEKVQMEQSNAELQQKYSQKSQ